MSWIVAPGSTASPYRSEISCTLRSASFMSSSTPLCVGSSARTMFSATVITGMSMKCWCTIPTPAAIEAAGEPSRTGFPLIRISPSSAW